MSPHLAPDATCPNSSSIAARRQESSTSSEESPRQQHDSREGQSGCPAPSPRTESSALPAIRTTYLVSLRGPDSASDLDSPSTVASTSILMPQSALRTLHSALRSSHKHLADVRPSYLEADVHHPPETWLLLGPHPSPSLPHDIFGANTEPRLAMPGTMDGGLAGRRASGPKPGAVQLPLDPTRCEAEELKRASGPYEGHSFASRAGSPSALSSASRTSTSESCNRGSSFTDRLLLYSSGSEVSSASQNSSEGAYAHALSDGEGHPRPWLDPATGWPSQRAMVSPMGEDGPATAASAHCGSMYALSDILSSRLSDSPRPQRITRTPDFATGPIKASGAAADPSSVSGLGRNKADSSGHDGRDADSHTVQGLRRLAVPIQPEQLLSRLLYCDLGSSTLQLPSASASSFRSSSSAPGTANGSPMGRRTVHSHQQREQPRLPEAKACTRQAVDAVAQPRTDVDGCPALSGTPASTSSPQGHGVPDLNHFDAASNGPHRQRRLGPNHDLNIKLDGGRARPLPVPQPRPASPMLAGGRSEVEEQQQHHAAAESRTATANSLALPHWRCARTATPATALAPAQIAAPAATATATATASTTTITGDRTALRKHLRTTPGSSSSSAPLPRSSSSSRPPSAPLSSSSLLPPSPVLPSSASTLRPGSTSPRSVDGNHHCNGTSPAAFSTSPEDSKVAAAAAAAGPSRDAVQEDLLAPPFDIASPEPPLIIDLRSLDAYLGLPSLLEPSSTVVTGRIRSSINVSLPKLILRRLSRSCTAGSGLAVSLPLESFVSTQVGKRRFAEVIDAASRSRQDQALKRHQAVSRSDELGSHRAEAVSRSKDMAALVQPKPLPASDVGLPYWNADVVVVYDEADSSLRVGSGGRAPGGSDAPAERPDEILLRALERVGPCNASDRGGGVYYVQGSMAEVKDKLGPRFWLPSEDTEQEPLSPRQGWTGQSLPLGDRRAGPSSLPDVCGNAIAQPEARPPSPSSSARSPVSTVDRALPATRSLSPLAPADSYRGAPRLDPRGETLSPSAFTLSISSQSDLDGVSPPPSLSPAAARPGRPVRPSLARLDTSERIKLADSSAGPVRGLARRSPNTMRLQLDTTVPKRSATMNAYEPPRRSVSRELSPRVPSLVLAPPPAAAARDDDVPPTPVLAQSLQSLCRLQSRLPPSASSFGDMSLLPGARGTFGFGAHDDQGQPHPAELDFEISTILPGFLYLGPNVQTRADLEELRKRGVKRILNMTYEIEEGGSDLNLASEVDRYLKIPMTDSVEAVGVQKSIEEACRYLDDARLHSSPTYVHCKAGKSRSVTIVIAYLIHANHWTLRKSYSFVAERRNAISPNIGFVAELMKFEEKVLNLSKSGGIIGGGNDGVGDASSGDGGSKNNEDSKKAGGREHVRESMPPLSRETLASLSSSGLTCLGFASDVARSDEGEPLPTNAGQREREGERETSLASTISSSSDSPSLGFAELMTHLGNGGRQIKITETGEVRGSDGRYRSRRPLPVDEVNLAPGRRATMAGLGK